MTVSREEKKVEAINRMKKIGVFNQTIRDFEKDDLVSVTEPPVGAFYWLDEDEQAQVKEFEEKHNALVYMVLRSWTDFGKMDSYFYVSDHKEEWKDDRMDLDDNIALVYVKNLDYPDCSEFGSIGFKRTCAAGFLRTY